MLRVGSMRLGQKDGSARQSGRIRRTVTDPPALETDPPSTTNAYSGAAIRDYLVWFGLVWFGLVWFGFSKPIAYCCPRIRVCGTRRIRQILSNAGGSVRAVPPRVVGGSVFCPSLMAALGAKFNKRCDRLKYQIKYMVHINPIVFTAKSTVLGIRFLSNQSREFLYGSRLYRGWALPLKRWDLCWTYGTAYFKI